MAGGGGVGCAGCDGATVFAAADCEGACAGGARLDAGGACCAVDALDCLGACNGTHEVSLSSAGATLCCTAADGGRADCAGYCDGSARLDECGECAALENTFYRCERHQKRIGCGGSHGESRGECVFDCSRGNCWIGENGGQWLATPDGWSLARFPAYPDFVHISKPVELQGDSRSMGELELVGETAARPGSSKERVENQRN